MSGRAADPIPWLLRSGEPWTRYRALVDLLDRPASDPEVRAARESLLAHEGIRALIAGAAAWGEHPITRHNDAGHALYQFSTLADFGLRFDDPGLTPGIEAILAHVSPEGAFQTPVSIGRAFGGTGENQWAWLLCDAPTLLYTLLAMGLGGDSRVGRASQHLAGLVQENGWRCVAAPELGKFRGPGRLSDPCPIANVYALKALALVPSQAAGEAAQRGTEMLLHHWEIQGERKMYLFGIGTDFRKLKYPFVWYDILHVVDVLSRFRHVHSDRRFREMVESITAQANEAGHYTASSAYRAWKDWPFADKKRPSPWLTFLCLRIQKRITVLDQT